MSKWGIWWGSNEVMVNSMPHFRKEANNVFHLLPLSLSLSFHLSSISLFSLTLSPSLSLFLLWDFSSSFRPSLEMYNHSHWLSMGFTMNIFVLWIWHRKVSRRVRLTHVPKRSDWVCLCQSKGRNTCVHTYMTCHSVKWRKKWAKLCDPLTPS